MCFLSWHSHDIPMTIPMKFQWNSHWCQWKPPGKSRWTPSVCRWFSHGTFPRWSVLKTERGKWPKMCCWWVAMWPLGQKKSLEKGRKKFQWMDWGSKSAGDHGFLPRNLGFQSIKFSFHQFKGVAPDSFWLRSTGQVLASRRTWLSFFSCYQYGAYVE